MEDKEVVLLLAAIRRGLVAGARALTAALDDPGAVAATPADDPPGACSVVHAHEMAERIKLALGRGRYVTPVRVETGVSTVHGGWYAFATGAGADDAGLVRRGDTEHAALAALLRASE